MAREFLMDANIWSEAVKLSPDRAVMRWLADHQHQLVMNAVVLGEIQAGVARLSARKRWRRLPAWVTELSGLVSCLGWDKKTALIWGQLVGAAQSRGDNLPLKDSMIAASALRHDLTVATRHVADFLRIKGVKVVNPFDDEE